MSAHHALLGDLRRFQAAAASASRTVGAPNSAVRARLADEAAAWQACIDLLSDPGVYAIAVERRRQVQVEGWSTAHDDAHDGGEMALAAGCYALFSAASDAARAATDLPASLSNTGEPLSGWAAFFSIWPWDRNWWKPKSRARDLERAGALAAAEISRLLRKAAQP